MNLLRFDGEKLQIKEAPLNIVGQKRHIA